MLAVTSAGIHVIDIKHYRDAKVEVRRSGGVFAALTERLYVGGRDRTMFLDSLTRQVDVVRGALDDYALANAIPITPSLCFVDAALPLFGTAQIDGVRSFGPKGATKMLLADEGILGGEQRAALRDHLAVRLPPAR